MILVSWNLYFSGSAITMYPSENDQMDSFLFSLDGLVNFLKRKIYILSQLIKFKYFCAGRAGRLLLSVHHIMYTAGVTVS